MNTGNINLNLNNLIDNNSESGSSEESNNIIPENNTQQILILSVALQLLFSSFNKN